VDERPAGLADQRRWAARRRDRAAGARGRGCYRRARAVLVAGTASHHVRRL